MTGPHFAPNLRRSVPSGMNHTKRKKASEKIYGKMRSEHNTTHKGPKSLRPTEREKEQTPVALRGLE